MKCIMGIRKIVVGKILANGCQFANIFPRPVIALYGILQAIRPCAEKAVWFTRLRTCMQYVYIDISSSVLMIYGMIEQ